MIHWGKKPFRIFSPLLYQLSYPADRRQDDSAHTGGRARTETRKFGSEADEVIIKFVWFNEWNLGRQTRNQMKSDLTRRAQRPAEERRDPDF